MGLAPVVGVLGAVSTVSSLNSQRKAARAQESAIETNKQASEAAAAQRFLEIQTAKDFSSYQARINQMSRQLGMYQQTMQLEAEAGMERLGQQQERFQNVQNLLQASIQATAERSGADQLRAGSTQRKLQVQGAARQENIAAQEGLTGAAQEVVQALSKGKMGRAVQEAVFASATGQGGRSNDVLRDIGLSEEVAGAVREFLRQEGISEQEAIQMLYADTISNTEEAIAYGEANQIEGNADRSELYSNILATGVDADIRRQGIINEGGRRAQLQTMNMANVMDANSDAANRIFAEAGWQAQANSATTQLFNQKAQLQAQKNSIQKPGLFDYLGAGVQAFTSVAPLFQQRQQQQAQPKNLLTYR